MIFAPGAKRRRAIEVAVYEAMESMGYYNPKVTVEQYKGEVKIKVTPGQPIRIGHFRLVFLGEAGNDIAFTALRESLPLKEGDVFHHGQLRKP
jgi:translocation and assembly module TamA